MINNVKLDDAFAEIKFDAVYDGYLKEIDVDDFTNECEICRDLINIKDLYTLIYHLSEYTEESAKIVVDRDSVSVYFIDYIIDYKLKFKELVLVVD